MNSTIVGTYGPALTVQASQQQASIAPAPPGQHLDIHANELENAVVYLRELVGRIENVGERLMGPSPTAGRPAAPESKPESMMQRLGLATGWLHDAVGRLHAATERLESL